jgi:hypothetical protein
MIYTKNIYDEHIDVLRYINKVTKELGVKDILFDADGCFDVLMKMRKIFPYIDKIDNASTFKKVANFVVFFVAISPIKSKFPKSIVGCLSEYNPNAIVAIDIALFCLEDSEIYRENSDNVLVSNPIVISDHSYFDILSALSTKDGGGITPYYQPLLSLFFEQLVYKTNKHCEYTDKSKVNYYKG